MIWPVKHAWKWLLFQSVGCKGFSSEGKESQGWKKNSTQEITVAVFVSADEGKVSKPIVIWQSKELRCFRLTSASHKLAEVSYFDDSKSSMQVESFLIPLIFKLERREEVLFYFWITRQSIRHHWLTCIAR